MEEQCYHHHEKRRPLPMTNRKIATGSQAIGDTGASNVSFSNTRKSGLPRRS
jgi:hypothetical protein